MAYNQPVYGGGANQPNPYNTNNGPYSPAPPQQYYVPLPPPRPLHPNRVP